MTTPIFPISPTDGQEYIHNKEDGSQVLFRYKNPPGVWTAVGGPLDADLVMIAEANNGPILSDIQERPLFSEDLPTLDPMLTRQGGFVENAIGTIGVDMEQYNSVLVASTEGNFALNPTGFRSSGMDVLHVTVYTTTTGHAFTFGAPHRFIGLTPDQIAWTAGKKRKFRFTYDPADGEWIGEELSAQFTVNVGVVESTATAPDMPDPEIPLPIAPFAAAVYRFDSGSYATGGVATSPSTIVGLNAASADAMVYLAVVDGDNAFSHQVSQVRWFVDPSSTTFTTWGDITPAIGTNGYAGASVIAPWKFEFDSRVDPTGQSNPLWSYDNDHDIYAQVLFTNGAISSVKVDLTVNNGVVIPPAPSAPTSFAVTAATNTLNASWVAPTTGETGTATITTGTKPASLADAWNSASIPIPQTTVAGDLVLLVVQVSNIATSPAITVPAGYVQMGTTAGAATPSTRWQAVYRRVATGATAAPTVSVVSANIGGYAVVLKGVNPNTVTDVSVAQGNNSTPGGITTATNGAMVVQCVMTNQENALALGTANGFTLEAGGGAFDTGRGLGWSAGCASKLQTTFGSVTAPVWSQTTGATGNYMAWHTIAFRPSATGGATTATGYEIRWGLTNPPTGSIVNVGNTPSYAITELTGGSLHHVQVRAYDTIGQRGPWASTSGTPSGGTQELTIKRTTFDWSRSSMGTNQNWSVFSTPLVTGGVYLPRVTNRYNMAKNGGGMSGGTNSFWDKIMGWNLSSYNSVRTSTKGFIGTDLGGVRPACTFQLSWTGNPARPYDYNGNPTTWHIDSLLDMARTARGDRNSNFIAGATYIKNDTRADWVPRIVLCPSHEANGAWYASFFGVQPELVGLSVLTGASPADWDRPGGQPGVAAALKHAGTTGDRGPVWALAWKQCVSMFKSVDPRFWFSLNLSSGSANPDGLPSGASGWNMNAIAQVSGTYDSMDVDIYGRGASRPRYNGTGDPDDPANYNFGNVADTLVLADQLRLEQGIPIGYGEMATQFVIPNSDFSGNANEYCTDTESAVWYKMTLDWYNARPSHLGFLWQDQVVNTKPSGTTYIPNASQHPKTMAVLASYFPA